MSVEVRIDEAEFRKANELLQRIDKQLRGPAITEALTKASTIVADAARREVPQPGYPFDKADKKPLRDTIAYNVKDYASGTHVSIVGAEYPAGAHAHLVELGHDVWVPKPPFKEGADAFYTGKRSKEDPFLERAADSTRNMQAQAIVSTMTQHAESVK